jgi:hypothetical protein
LNASGIVCPEKGQAFGNNAKHAASDLAFGAVIHEFEQYRSPIFTFAKPSHP